jgi:hypothetical protein
MNELQIAVDALMGLILSGGAEAAKELVKGAVLNGAKELSDAWRALFGEAPETYPLADRLVRNPHDAALSAQLRELLGQMLRDHPELLPAGALAVRTGDIQAGQGSVAAAVIQGATINIGNRS